MAHPAAQSHQSYQGPESALLHFFSLSLQGHKTAAAAPSIASLQVIPKQEGRGIASACVSPPFIREQKIHPRIRGRYWFRGTLTIINKIWAGGCFSLRKDYVIRNIKLGVETWKKPPRVRSPDA